MKYVYNTCYRPGAPDAAGARGGDRRRRPPPGRAAEALGKPTRPSSPPTPPAETQGLSFFGGPLALGNPTPLKHQNLACGRANRRKFLVGRLVAAEGSGRGAGAAACEAAGVLQYHIIKHTIML